MPLFFKYLTLVTFAVFVFAADLFSQNGPGGVGSSGSNVLWLDANRGVTVSGTSVTAWADQSGNSFTAVPNPGVSTCRPLRLTNSANGYPVIDFDGTDDELWINHNTAFNLTQWHFFIVPYAKVQKDYNAWVTKGNDGQENFEMLSYSDGNVHTPIYYTDATRTSPSTASAQVASTVNVIEYSYSSSVGRDVYKNNSSINTDNENKTPSNNSFSVYIGNEKTTSRFINGGLAELIMYNAPLNSAQRIIVNNYLAAKYNCTLSANDYYTQDNSSNGNYDHDVAGIGRVNSSNIHNDARGSGIVRILNPTGLDDGEFYLWGHDNGALGIAGVNDYPSSQGVQGRVARVWRGSEVGTITNFEVRFDLSNMGSVTASQLCLLVDTNNDGAFADETTAGGGVIGIGSATSLGSNVYGFSSVTAINNGNRFTIGTTNKTTTPLPIELIDFAAVMANGKVFIKWATASEINNDHFTIERSKDGINFSSLLTVKGAVNKQTRTDYEETDFEPLSGTSYYRLKQTDVDGSASYSEIVTVNLIKQEQTLTIFPNPASQELNIDVKGSENRHVLVVIRDAAGKEYYSKMVISGERIEIEESEIGKQLPSGVYFVIASSDKELYSHKLIVK
jgi:hypothetical protein